MKLLLTIWAALAGLALLFGVVFGAAGIGWALGGPILGITVEVIVFPPVFLGFCLVMEHLMAWTDTP